MEQHAEILRKALRTAEIVAGNSAGSESVGVGPVGGEDVQGIVPIGQVEHLVLQKMGHARRGVYCLPVQGKAAVGSAVVCGEDGVAGGKALLGHHVQPQAVGQHAAVQRLAYVGVFTPVHLHSPPQKLPLHPDHGGSISCRTPRCLQWR